MRNLWIQTSYGEMHNCRHDWPNHQLQVEFGKTEFWSLPVQLDLQPLFWKNLPKLKNEIRVLKIHSVVRCTLTHNQIEKFSSTHESMREKDRLYSIQKSPIVNLDKVKALVSEFRIDQGRSLESVIFKFRIIYQDFNPIWFENFQPILYIEIRNFSK